LRPAHQVAGRADGELADFAGPAEAGRAAAGGDIEHLAGGHPGRAVPLPAQQQRRPGLGPQRRAVGGRRAVAAETDRRARRAQLADRREAAAADEHVRAGAVRHADAGGAEAGHLGWIRIDAVRHP